MKESDRMRVPLVDLQLQHQRVAEEVKAGFERVLSQTSFVLGPEAESFEGEYAQFCGVRHCIGVGNGTDAIEIALRSSGLGMADEVILPANTFIATAEAVLRTGARVVLADCDENFLIDPDSVGECLTRRTRAVIPVHLYGQMAPMRLVEEILPTGVALVEDAAQAQGAAQSGRRAGSVGLAAATSFYPGKNLGAYGDAGAVLTNSDAVAERARRIRNHGGARKYEHAEMGLNSRLDGLQAVVLRAKLRQLEDWNAERAKAASQYDHLLDGLPEVQRPTPVPGNDHVWHLYVVRVPRRDEVVARLNAVGIGAGIHYPAPVHLTDAFQFLEQGRGSFPVAEKLAEEILSLPIYPGITAQQQEFVAEQLRLAIRGA